MSDYHWNHGWTFTRQPNGDVEVTKRLPIQERVAVTVVAPETGPSSDNLRYRPHVSDIGKRSDEWAVVSPFVLAERFTIPAAEWVSIVTAMTGVEASYQQEAHEFAEALHDGKVIVTRTGHRSTRAV